MTDFGFESTTRPDVFAEIDPERPDPNWSVWHAAAQSVPRNLTVAVWHETQMRQLAWVLFFGCLSIGVTLQRFRISLRLRLALAFAALAAAASFAAGGFYSLLLGACVAGTLLSILTWGPPFVRSARSIPKQQRRMRPESTVTFEYRALLFFIAIGTLGARAAGGLDVPVNAQPKDARAVGAAVNELSELLVVVPTRGGESSAAKPLRR